MGVWAGRWGRVGGRGWGGGPPPVGPHLCYILLYFENKVVMWGRAKRGPNYVSKPCKAVATSRNLNFGHLSAECDLLLLDEFVPAKKESRRFTSLCCKLVSLLGCGCNPDAFIDQMFSTRPPGVIATSLRPPNLRHIRRDPTKSILATDHRITRSGHRPTC